MSSTKYEKNFYRTYIVNAKENYICFDASNQKVELKGNRESPVYNQSSSYIIFTITKCQTNETFTCASAEEIEEWIEGKIVVGQSISSMVNYLSRDSFVYPFEKWLPAIKLGGVFTDAGFRFRNNNLKIKNNWYDWFGHSEKLENFYDIVFYNNDEIPIPKKK